ncbi:ParB/RepB/Spo0J family partition protein [Pelagicoccus sp. SDUM812005]|uniref:ParB/RepB/Spo0J family partition protein n=1 Tax=Pelagicoccus sp. SDUM812005 TaxID=3041257 RepID=UPI00280C8E95|nr:ParB/RepB/Spo0J family partition protein [Pelagicoccus sp. SDUM812005]MDQ8179491.1 ParB/RepB/Spo0J family partition protein [Pelagicoccus sp. SDUM812005]
MNLQRIALDQIDIYSGTQTRVATNDEAVSGYAEDMKQGAQFPPIVLYFDGSKYYLADGFHRFLAAKRIEERDIEAEVREGSRTDALVAALGANATNGLYRTNADKRHAVEIALEEWTGHSNAYLADICKVSIELVRRVRKAMGLDHPDKVIGKDGKSYPTGIEKTARHGGEEREKNDGSSGEGAGAGGGGGAPSKKNANYSDTSGGTRNEIEEEARSMIRNGEMDPRELDTLPTAIPNDYAVAAIGILDRMKKDDPKYPAAIERIEKWVMQRKAELLVGAES